MRVIRDPEPPRCVVCDTRCRTGDACCGGAVCLKENGEKKMRRYQIIRKPRGADGRWSFVAHGAAYSKDAAISTKEQIEAMSGDTVRLLAI